MVHSTVWKLSAYEIMVLTHQYEIYVFSDQWFLKLDFSSRLDSQYLSLEQENYNNWEWKWERVTAEYRHVTTAPSIFWTGGYASSWNASSAQPDFNQ
jgi:hypothetical protein